MRQNIVTKSGSWRKELKIMIKWFETVGDHSDIVISSRIRLARNLVNYPFCGRLTPEQEKQLKAEVKNA